MTSGKLRPPAIIKTLFTGQDGRSLVDYLKQPTEPCLAGPAILSPALSSTEVGTARGICFYRSIRLPDCPHVYDRLVVVTCFATFFQERQS